MATRCASFRALAVIRCGLWGWMRACRFMVSPAAHTDQAGLAQAPPVARRVGRAAGRPVGPALDPPVARQAARAAGQAAAPVRARRAGRAAGPAAAAAFIRGGLLLLVERKSSQVKMSGPSDGKHRHLAARSTPLATAISTAGASISAASALPPPQTLRQHITGRWWCTWRFVAAR